MIQLLVLAALAAPAAAHQTLWHPAMYGWAKDMSLPEADFTFDQWWFKGELNDPPAANETMSLPSGGTFHAQIASNVQFTHFPDHGYDYDDAKDSSALKAQDGNIMSGLKKDGSVHSADPYGTPIGETKDLKGCAIAIAYESDVTKIKPEDFTVITTNHSCAWYRDTDFQIPSGLPACPEGGCHCMWGWIHSAIAGSSQMFTIGYRCNITNPDLTAPSIPAPEIARKCPFDKNNCTVGSKQMHYWLQKERNNNFQESHDPPFYNEDYGFMNGAQTDLWEAHKAFGPVNESDWAPGTLATSTMNIAITPASSGPYATVNGSSTGGGTGASTPTPTPTPAIASTAATGNLTTAVVSTPGYEAAAQPTTDSTNDNTTPVATAIGSTAGNDTVAESTLAEDASVTTPASTPTIASSGKKKCSKRRRRSRTH